MEIRIKCNREKWCQAYQKAFVKVTNSRQRKCRRAHLDRSEHSNNCLMALRWGLAQETHHGHGSAKIETMMSGGERGVSGRRGELFRKRPWEKSSPISSLMAATEIKTQFAGVSWAELTGAIRDGRSDQDRYKEGPQRLDCTGRGKKSGVFQHEQNESWKRTRYKAGRRFKEWRCSKRGLFNITRRGRRRSRGRVQVRELLCHGSFWKEIAKSSITQETFTGDWKGCKGLFRKEWPKRRIERDLFFLSTHFHFSTYSISYNTFTKISLNATFQVYWIKATFTEPSNFLFCTFLHKKGKDFSSLLFFHLGILFGQQMHFQLRSSPRPCLLS